MGVDICCVESRYLTACKKQDTEPNSSILCGFNKARALKSLREVCCFEVFLDDIKESDIPSLIDLFSVIDSSEIEAVDFIHKTPCALINRKYILSLIRLVGKKVRIVDLGDVSCSKAFMRDLFQGGLSCQLLSLSSWRTRKLNIPGKFMQIHTLNLDFNASLSSFSKDCFTCMPNLSRLSLCGTRIANLWTTTAALSKLKCLREIRFQNCLCCSDTRHCPASPGGKATSFAGADYNSVKMHPYLYMHPSSNGRKDSTMESPTREEIFYDAFSDDDSYSSHHLTESTSEESSDESELDISNHCQEDGSWEARLADALSKLSGFTPDNGPSASICFPPVVGETHTSGDDEFMSGFGNDVDSRNRQGIMVDTHEIDVSSGTNEVHSSGCDCVTRLLSEANVTSCSTLLADGQCTEKETNFCNNKSIHERALKKYKLHHPSPICFEKHYREYMIASLPRLQVLDNLCIRNGERKRAKLVFSQHFEYLPYNRRCNENVISIIQCRETGGSAGGQRPFKFNQPYSISKSTVSFTRSVSAAKVGSALWSVSRPMSKFKVIESGDTKKFRPRQFEYHPSDPSLMVFGTLDGELVFVNLESGKIVGYAPSVGALNSVLGLCWLKKYPSKLIAGSDNGVLQLYDVCRMGSTISDRVHQTDPATCTFEEFEQLTSVHVNSTDEYFLASGYTKNVALYDIASGKRVQTYEDLHQEHINVVKFAHYSPFLFATSSFDHDIKLWDLRQKPLHPCYTTSSSRGNVMVCFSPDDHYLLSSAVDNEVRQHLAVDGRLHMKLEIASLGSAHNYTRSYYMSGGDYIISGSCEESVIHVCCAQTGRRLRDIALEGAGSRKSRFVQSLRGDPFRAFHMSVLAAYVRPSTSSEIIQFNLLSSDTSDEDKGYDQHQFCPRGLGG